MAPQAPMSDSFKVTLVVGFYFVTSISLVFLNKHMLSSSDVDLDAPLFLTWTQLAVTVGCCMVLSSMRKSITVMNFPAFEFRPEIAVQVLPLTVVFLGMVVFNNLCLKYVEVSFYQVARALTIVFNIALTYFFLGSKTSARAIAACVVVVAGYVMGVEGEINFDLRGVVFGLASSLFVALYSIFVKRVLPVLKNDEFLLLIYNNVIAMLLLPVVIVFADELPDIFAYSQLFSAHFLQLTLLTGVFGFLINISTFLQIKHTSALTHNVSGTAKACVQTLLGIYIYQNEVSAMAATGTLISIFGCALYSYVRFLEMTPQPAKGDHIKNLVADEQRSPEVDIEKGTERGAARTI